MSQITGKITQKFGLFLPTGFYSVLSGKETLIQEIKAKQSL